MTMRVYAFDLMPWPHLTEASYYPDPNRLYDPALGRQVYDEHFRQMELYEECGYDAICINEHHAKPYGLMPSPNLVAAALTQRTKKIKIGIFGNLPALHAHPLRLAEEVAMLDVMSGGRVISGFVRGVPQEFLAYSLPLADARPRMTEAWDLIVKAWTEREPFEWRGKYFNYDRVSIWPRPLQEPHPPIILPADSEEGLEIAASRRVPTGSAYRTVARARAVFDRYRELALKHGWTATPEDCHLVRHVYVAETNARAREEVESHLNYFWQKLLSYHRGSMALMGQSPKTREQTQRTEELPLYELDFDLCQKEGMSIVGDPDYVIREIRAQMREVGAGVLVALLQFGSMPHELTMKNIRLFSEKVLPTLKRD
ncbi:MAG: hypothetical protein DME05_15790 [Candidatus Rokuibacteriota bacterium]|nr:MAG: hypothetical protein DME05_15790 [Candidatus Rokubacteria bacterium]